MLLGRLHVLFSVHNRNLKNPDCFRKKILQFGFHILHNKVLSNSYLPLLLKIPLYEVAVIPYRPLSVSLVLCNLPEQEELLQVPMFWTCLMCFCENYGTAFAVGRTYVSLAAVGWCIFLDCIKISHSYL